MGGLATRVGAGPARLGPCVALVIAGLIAAGCAAPSGGPARVYTDPPPRTTATPLAGSAEAEAVVRAFGKLKGRGDLTFHVVETIATTGSGLKATMSIDVAGSDLALVLKADGETLELRHVGGGTFARIGKGRWHAGVGDEQLLDELADPWLYVCWLNALTYTGPVGPDGRPIASPAAVGSAAEGSAAEGSPAGSPSDAALGFACPDPYSYQSPTMVSQGIVGRIDELALVLRPDGTPVRMTVAGSGPTLVSRSETFHATMTFTKVGERIVIKVPKT